MIIAFSVYVNDHPFWYRPCDPVNIHVDDATGLRRKSPVKTLGLDIGYIAEVKLDEEKVLVKVCVTGPVKLTPDTRAFIRTNGFLGDKFIELKPVERVGEMGEKVSPSVPPAQEEKPSGAAEDSVKNSSAAPSELPKAIYLENTSEKDYKWPWENEKPKAAEIVGRTAALFLSLFEGTAEAAEKPPATLNASREAELQDTVKKVGKLIDQLTLMVGDLREVTQQREFKDTVVNLNSAMKHLEELLRPNGKVMKNVDSAMESLKNTMADAEKAMKKISDGEGTLGKIINDPSLYEELRGAIKSVNLLLGKAGNLKTYVDISGMNIPAYDGARANFSLMIAPNPTRYYLIGLTNDPRGRDRKTVTTTAVNNGPASVEVKNVNEEKGLRITAMFGKRYGHLDLRVGLMEDYGAVSAGYWFDDQMRYGVRVDAYSLGKGYPYTGRITARAQVIPSVYVTGGLDTTHRYMGKRTFFTGIGLFFDDDDIKYLFAFR
jgi:phospholipid/cholesterol/gamma-HCH transport system substrate-binding protein